MICLNTQQQTLEYQNCSFILKYLLSSKSRDIHAEPNLVLTGYSKVVIDTDSTSCGGFLSSGCLPTHSCTPLVEEIRSMLPYFVDIMWGHVFREANAVA